MGLVQAAVAVPLRNYGVPYATGFAYGLALQALEMAVGVGLGLIALAREGISFAVLRRMQDEEELRRGCARGRAGDGRRSSSTRLHVRALLCPASLKGVLSAPAAAWLANKLAARLRRLPFAPFDLGGLFLEHLDEHAGR